MIRALLLAILVLGSVTQLRAQSPSVTRVELSPDTLRMRVGETQTISLTAYDTDGEVVIPEEVGWFAGWENTRIDQQGNIQAINAGSTIAGAAVSPGNGEGAPIVGRIAVVVEPADPHGIRIIAPPDLPVGSFVPLEAVAIDHLGNELWDATMTLESSDPEVVEVVGSSLAYREQGSATIRARVGGTVEEVKVVITAPVSEALTLTAASTEARTGDAIKLEVRAGEDEVTHPQ